MTSAAGPTPPRSPLAEPSTGDVLSRRARRLARWVAWWPSLAVGLALALLVATGDWFICAEVGRHAQGVVDRRAEVLAHSLSEQLSARLGEVSALARSPLLRARDPAGKPFMAARAVALRAELNWLLEHNEAYVWLGWADATGQVQVASRGWLEGRSIAQRPVFAQSLHTPFLGEAHAAVTLAPLLQAQRGAGAVLPQLIDLGLPVLDEQGALLGVLAVQLDPARLVAAALPTALSRQEPFPLEVQLLVGAPPRPLPIQGPDVGPAWVAPGVGHGVGPGGAASAVPSAPKWLDEAQRHVSPSADAAGERWFIGVQRLDGLTPGALPWRVLVSTREAAVEAEVLRLVLGAGALGLLIAAAVGFVTWRVALRVTRPWQPWFVQMLARQDAERRGAPRPWGSLVDGLGAAAASAPLSAALADQPLAAADGQARLPEQAFEILARDAWQLKQVVDQLPVGLALADPQMRVLYANQAYQAQTGESAEALRGTPLNLPLVPASGRPEHLELLYALERQPASTQRRSSPVAADGSRFDLSWQIRPLRSASGAVVGFLSVVSDLTAELRALREAAAEGHRLKLYADAVQDVAMVMLDADGRVVDWSEGARQLKGYTAAQAMQLPLATFFPPEDVAKGLPERLLEQARRSGRASMEGWHVRADGSRFWCRGFLYRLPAQAAPAAIAMITRDLSAVHAADLRLAEQRAALQALAQRLLGQEKETTRRLAQALHDELGQTLAALRLNADLMLPRLNRCLISGGVDGGPCAEAPASRHLQRVDQLIDLANQQVRGALTELRPPLIDERGLWAALDNELQRGVPAADPALALRLQAEPALELQRWPADVEYAAFMVAREALFNAVRHASAQEVQVRLEGDAQHLVLTVRDDGVGLPEGADGAVGGKPGHLGLVGMHERAQAIGARLVLLSVPAPGAGHGTTVELSWPMHND